MFSIKSLRALEEMAGIDIVTPLAKHHDEVISAAQINLSKSQQKKLDECESNCERLEFVIDHWKSGNSVQPRNWRSLLSILDFVDLGDLKQQISNCLGKYS